MAVKDMVYKKKEPQINLNTFDANSDNGDCSLPNNSVIDGLREVQVFFRDLEKHLIEEIRKFSVVFGCIAWLTNENILKTLSNIENVSIIVQKEDFLRPDLKSKLDWKTKLRSQYNNLSCDLDRYRLEGIGSSLSTNGDVELHPVRCVGNHNKDKSPAFPRMHNKFLVFGDTKDSDDGWKKIEYKSVWTGSFNLTKNATMSLENAVLIQNKEIVLAYANEFSNIYALSKPLDWESDWVAPEYRIGS